jgi:hypothetical protein
MNPSLGKVDSSVQVQAKDTCLSVSFSGAARFAKYLLSDTTPCISTDKEERDQQGSNSHLFDNLIYTTPLSDEDLLKVIYNE